MNTKAEPSNVGLLSAKRKKEQKKMRKTKKKKMGER
jgi:hypothetical protein